MESSKVADRLVQVAPSVLGDPQSWMQPCGYPESLALCVIDAIQSVGVRYASVVAVVDRYRTYRGGAADCDGTPELLGTFRNGGAERWAVEIGNHNRTYSRRTAPLKAAVILEAAEMLCATGIATTVQVRGLEGEHLHALEDRWRRLPGQRSGITWRYVLMLAGLPGVKPDRMIHRFLAQYAGAPIGSLTNDLAARVVTDVAAALGVSATALDHAMWRHASGRPPTSPQPDVTTATTMHSAKAAAS